MSVIIERKRFAAVRDNRTKILIDKPWTLYKNGRRLTRQETIDSFWRPVDKIQQARILTWSTYNKAVAALKNSSYIEGIDDYEIIEITESWSDNDNN